jgi:hypothetical protein
MAGPGDETPMRSAPWIAGLAGAVLLLPMPALAGDHDPPSQVHVATNTGGLSTGVTQGFPGHHTEQQSTPGETVADHPDVPAVAFEQGLLDTFCAGVNWSQGCVPEPGLPPQPALVTPGIVATAFRDLPLPAAELVVQPPGGATLVNFATNFYTEQGEFTRTVRLLGQRVELRIWPSQFGWRFGDGRSLASASAGAPYPDLQITHEYATKGPVRPSVDTTYAAQFRVNGGPWRDVNGTVTIPGSPVRLRVRTATPVLVGYH